MEPLLSCIHWLITRKNIVRFRNLCRSNFLVNGFQDQCMNDCSQLYYNIKIILKLLKKLIRMSCVTKISSIHNEECNMATYFCNIILKGFIYYKYLLEMSYAYCFFRSFKKKYATTSYRRLQNWLSISFSRLWSQLACWYFLSVVKYPLSRIYYHYEMLFMWMFFSYACIL